MNKFTFDKKVTAVLKGIALLLMFEHHLFGFPEWLTQSKMFISIPFDRATTAYYFGKFGNICVAMFMFITGYGLCFSFKKGCVFKNSIKKTAIFLAEFWIMLFTFFLPIEYLFGTPNFTPAKILEEMFGLSVTLVSFAWYVRFYILAMLTLPLMRKILDKSVGGTILLIVLYSAACVATRMVSAKIDFGMTYVVIEEYFRYMPIVMLGYMTANYKLFERADEKLAHIKLANTPFAVLLCAAVILLRVKVFGKTYLYLPSADIFLCPIFMYALIKIINKIKCTRLLNFLSVIGANSMNLWFLQAVFYGNTAAKLQWIAYIPKFSVLVVIWSVLCLLPISMLYNLIFKKLFNNG